MTAGSLFEHLGFFFLRERKRVFNLTNNGLWRSLRVLSPVDNLAHPAGNRTGCASYAFSFGKWLQTLEEAAPEIRQVLL
jgi:hypothetical protein